MLTTSLMIIKDNIILAMSDNGEERHTQKDGVKGEKVWELFIILPATFQ